MSKIVFSHMQGYTNIKHSDHLEKIVEMSLVHLEGIVLNLLILFCVHINIYLHAWPVYVAVLRGQKKVLDLL